MGLAIRTVARIRDLNAQRGEAEMALPAERDDAVAAAEADCARITDEAKAELARQTERIDKELAEGLGQVETKAAKRLKSDRHTADRALAQEAANYKKRQNRIVKQELEAEWLADAVFENGEPKAKAEYAALLGELHSGQNKLESIEAAALQLADPALRRRTCEPDEPSKQFEDGRSVFAGATQQAANTFEQLSRRRLHRFVGGGTALFLILLASAAAAAAIGFAMGWTSWAPPAIGGGAVLLLGLCGLIPLTRAAHRQLFEGCRDVLTHVQSARKAADLATEQGKLHRDETIKNLESERNAELKKGRDRVAAAREQIDTEHSFAKSKIETARDSLVEEISTKRDADVQELERRGAAHRASATAKHKHAHAKALKARNQLVDDARQQFEEQWARIRDEWLDGMRSCTESNAQLTSIVESFFPSWTDESWSDWRPRADAAPAIALGKLSIDLSTLDGADPKAPDLLEGVETSLDIPTLMDLPGPRSLVIECAPEEREHALESLRVTMLRLLTSQPPGRVRFTLVDPVGLGQSFAGFMRLSDETPQLVGARIWTEPRHIEQRLAELTEHMESVIQKYLRTDFPTIEEYNKEAGEIAEPYRVLVLADFPTGFSEAACKRLASIADSGPRCGVYVLALTSPDAKTPDGIDLDFLRARSTTIRQQDTEFRLNAPGCDDLPLSLDLEPNEALFTQLLEQVGEGAQNASEVKVPFEILLPDEANVWSRSCANELRIPLGKTGATKQQELCLGKGTSQHVLIAGKTGSGKSTLLHVLITTAVLWYGPDELEFYLIDFKKGVEFKAYADGAVPHVRVVAIESDREFGLSVLRRLDDELKHRGDLFRDAGAQSVAQFREIPGSPPMPRILLVIDEFQEFFTEDDQIGNDAALLLDRLVRQGRAFGIHVLLGSQTLSGAYSLARSTVGQMAVRIALQCSETDSYLILSEDNAAARLLARPGEAIYNDTNGLIEGNSPFQTAWLGDRQRDAQLLRAATRAAESSAAKEAPIVFEGNAQADLAQNQLLRRAIATESAPPVTRIWLGDPVSISDPVSAALRRRSGSNLLIVGQQEDAATAMMEGALVSLAAQHDPSAATVHVIDATPEDQPLATRLAQIAGALPHQYTVRGWRDVEEVITAADRDLTEREEANRTDAPPVFLLIHGLQRLRTLRRSDDDFSFSLDDGDGAKSPSKMLGHILEEGPGFGVHVICWCDTTSNLQRFLDRSAIGQFGSRVLLQMSASDSSMLLESVGASKLGLRRAIFFEEERGEEEKFRPYGLTEPEAISDLASLIAQT